MLLKINYIKGLYLPRLFTSNARDSVSIDYLCIYALRYNHKACIYQNIKES